MTIFEEYAKLTKVAAKEGDLPYLHRDEEGNVIRTKKPKGLKAEDITDTEGIGGKILDYAAPMSFFSARRAGRGTALADATGRAPGFELEHPNTAGMAYGLGGAAIGGGLGYLLDRGMNQGGSPYPGVATAIGAGAAGLLGILLATHKRRSLAQAHAKAFDKADTLTVKDPDINRLAGFFGGSTHQSGRMEGLEKALGKRDKKDDDGLGTDIARTGLGAIGGGAGAAAIVGGVPELASVGNIAGWANTGVGAFQTQDAKTRERALFHKSAAVLAELLKRNLVKSA